MVESPIAGGSSISPMNIQSGPRIGKGLGLMGTTGFGTTGLVSGGLITGGGGRKLLGGFCDGGVTGPLIACWPSSSRLFIGLF